jgi:hypothetical protein
MGVSLCGLAIYIKKYLKAKEELWKLKNYFTMQNYNLKKIKIKKNLKKNKNKNQNPSRYYNTTTNLKFEHKPKYIIFPKSSYKNRPIIIIIT